MDEKFDENKLKSLKLITYGTERMPKNLLEKLNKSLPKVRLMQTFGTSETGILKTKSMSSDSLFFKIIDENQQYKIVDNELYLKSNTSVGKYINHQNSSFIKGGWFKTGDIVETNNEGYIKIIGRKNKVINVGGLKVMPNEVENIINSHKDVIDSTVYGEQNNITGYIVCANIVSKNKNKLELRKEIKKLCLLKLDKYKVPIKIKFENLQMNNRGKKLN
jgi:acyl-coenzyme A synthetase/AMP-(fatty) acid ligase